MKRWLWWRPDVGRAALAVAVLEKFAQSPHPKNIYLIKYKEICIFIVFFREKYVWPIGGRVVVHRRV